MDSREVNKNYNPHYENPFVQDIVNRIAKETKKQTQALIKQGINKTQRIVPGKKHVGGGPQQQQVIHNLLTPYTGQFASGCRIPYAGASGNKQAMGKTVHYANSTISSLQVAFPNWYINDSFAETGSGGDSTITASVEYPTGTLTQIKWSNVASVTISDGATSALSDAVSISIPAGAKFWIRCFYDGVNSVVFENGGSVNASDTANGEEHREAASGLSDQTMTPGALSGGTNLPARRYSPILLVASIRIPSICLIGDSRVVGISDSFDGTNPARGTIERSIWNQFGFTNLSKQGDQITAFIAGHTNRVAVADYFTHVITDYGYNDIVTLSKTAAQVATSITTVAGYYSGKSFYALTLSTKSTSTDSWATLDNQTVFAQNATRLTYNSLLRDGISGVTGYFDILPVEESQTQSGKWVVNGNANFATADGIHQSQAICIAIANSGIINIPW